MRLGVAYYPEQWDRSLWSEDVERMKEAGITIVRLAEFTWALMEPEEGRFQFEWLDQWIDFFTGKGMQIVLGTPTAAPPMWLHQMKPDIHQVDRNGAVRGEGSRRDYCANSETFLHYADRITFEVGARYGGKRGVIGFQVDNEIGCHNTVECYCTTCQSRFREYVKEKYKSIEALNLAWGNEFWSNQLQSWEQIKFYMNTAYASSPSYQLDLHRFFGETWVRFLKRQADILKSYVANQFITHNYAGPELRLDQRAFAEPQDFVSMDIYPVPELDVYQTVSFSNDIANSFSHGNKHWIMEISAGTPAAVFYKGPQPRPGQRALWLTQCYAHGAEAVLLYRWRRARAGWEMFGNGLIDHDNKPRRAYEELKRYAEDAAVLHRHAERLTPLKEAAILIDSDDFHHSQIHKYPIDVDYIPHLRLYYDALVSLGIGVKFVDKQSDLSPYPLVLAPNLYAVDGSFAEKLKRYVEHGGIFVTCLLAGIKTQSGTMVEETLPGHLTDLLGVELVEYERNIAPYDNEIAWIYGNDAPFKQISCGRWNFQMKCTTAASLCVYQRQFYKGASCITLNSYGEGRALYIGTMLEKGDAASFTKWLLQQAGIHYYDDLPVHLQAVKAQQNEHPYLWLLNHGSEPVTYDFAQPMMDCLTNETTNRMTLEAKKAVLLSHLVEQA